MGTKIDWYNRFLDTLRGYIYQGKDTAHMIQSKVLQFLEGKNEKFKPFTKKDLESGNLDGFHAECLTDTWIGNQRWAFIDLSAGPFSWGPSVGGEGVRTEQSLPNVDKNIGAVAEDEAEDRLQEAIQDKLAVFGEMMTYFFIAYQKDDPTAVVTATSPTAGLRLRLSDTLLETGECNLVAHLDLNGVIELLNMASMKPCTEFQNYTVARHTFLSHLGATLWGSLRHIISPSLADEMVELWSYYPTFDFSHRSEDPALAMAFSVATRAAAVPLLLSGKHFVHILILLFFSRLHGHASLKALVFFSGAYTYFVYMHKAGLHWKSPSFGSFTMRSEPSSWESHLQCNGQSLLWDLRTYFQALPIPEERELLNKSKCTAGMTPMLIIFQISSVT
ncbi:hypothetical protein SASPL_148667 [Salvia splendens]|uniref:DUF7906 domain-containing protein n=1 Tax=Salvia splendens TaxID=180675 RepID=A0A8X8W9R4_SALSN|nr:hypothetical protein SASPL_148667 [Salvia splendens]